MTFMCQRGGATRRVASVSLLEREKRALYVGTFTTLVLILGEIDNRQWILRDRKR
jgi:hypothetical protein